MLLSSSHFTDIVILVFAEHAWQDCTAAGRLGDMFTGFSDIILWFLPLIGKGLGGFCCYSSEAVASER